MSILLLLESFDWCADNQLARDIFNTSGGGLHIAGGRTGNGWGEGISGTVVDGSGHGYRQWTAGMAVSGGFEEDEAYILFKAFDPFGQASISLDAVGDGRLQVTAHLGGSTISSDPSGFTMHDNQGFVYLELQASGQVINVIAMGLTPPSWYVEYTYSVQVNGSPISVGSGVLDSPSLPGASATNGALFTQLQLEPLGAGGVIDDVYMTDSEFLGDISVQTLFPAADGTHTDWTPFVAGSHFLMVNEHNPGQDDDVTYNAAPPGAINAIDSYLFDHLVPFTPPMGTTGIKGVQAMISFKKSDFGTALTTGVWILAGGMTQEVFPAMIPGTTYICQSSPMRYSINTGSEWTQTEVNALEFGGKRLA